MPGERVSTKEFDLAIDAAAAKFGLSIEAAFRAISFDAFERVVRRTPVGDADYWVGHPKGNPPGNRKPPPGYVGGYARNNWWFSKNTNDNKATGRRPGSGTGFEAFAAIQLGVLGAKIGDTISIQNGVPYIWRLEAGTLSPRQAPHGMVAITFAEIQTHFQQMLNQAMENK